MGERGGGHDLVGISLSAITIVNSVLEDNDTRDGDFQCCAVTGSQS